MKMTWDKYKTSCKTKYGKKLLVLGALNLIFCFSNAQTSDKPSDKTGDKQMSDQVDLKKLEDKYWAAKDDEYGVIQNRTFSKTGKMYASLVYGPLINDPFAKAKASGLMLGYFINEDFGLELSYLTYGSTQNDTVSSYENQFGGAKPDFNLVKVAKFLSLTYTPFYAKMAFMNIGILYFDMGFTLGLGQTDYEIQKVNKDNSGVKSQANEMKSSGSFQVGFMQQLFIKKNIAFRLDVINSYYTQTTKQYEIGIGAPESARTSNSKGANDTTISVGLTFFSN